MKSLLLAVVALFTVATSLHGQSPIVKLEGQVACCAECWAAADRNKVQYGTAANLTDFEDHFRRRRSGGAAKTDRITVVGIK